MQYRILNIDGTISQKIFTVIGDLTGVKVTLRSTIDNQDVIVHKNRMIPADKTDQALCIVSGNETMVICPKCLSIFKKQNDDGSFVCDNGCGTYPYHSLDSKSSENRSSKVMSLKKKNIFEIEEVKKYPSMAVYSKTNKFNHAKIDSRSIVILHNSDKPRKMQFNIYNGSMGKKAPPLPLEAFDKNDIPSFGKCPWVAIASFDAETRRLLADGYTQIT